MKSVLIYSFTFLIMGCTMSTNNSITETSNKNSDNPFFEKSKLYMGFPPFDLIKNEPHVSEEINTNLETDEFRDISIRFLVP